MYLVNVAVCLSTNAALTVSRYGVRDRLAWMSAALCTSLLACACLTWLPHAPYVIFVLLACSTAALLLARTTRNLALCVLLPAAAYKFTSDFAYRPLVR
jgi:hypothetical protein